MAKLPAIPEKLHQQVMNYHAEGHTAPEISDLLKTQHGVIASFACVNRLIVKIRKERQEIAKAKYAEEMEKTAAQDVKIMSEVVNQTYKDWKAADNIKDKLNIAAELRMWVKDKMALSGIDKENNNHDQDAKDELLDELEELKNNKSIN